MVNIIIVDDSNFIRIALEKMFIKYPDIEVIGMFCSGIEALKFLDLDYTPIDVIILDFFMPEIDGIETLKRIMRQNPIPTLILTSASREEHAQIYFDALKYGAFDIIPKPSGSISLNFQQVEAILIEKINLAVKSKNKLRRQQKAAQLRIQVDIIAQSLHNRNKNESTISLTPQSQDLEKYLYQRQSPPNFKTPKKKSIFHHPPPLHLMIIGASTGGPPVLSEILTAIEVKADVALLIIQHMPESFTRYFAQRLDKISRYNIIEAKNGMILQPGCGYVAPGNYHISLTRQENQIILNTNQKPKMHAIRPAIDMTLPSAAEIFREHLLYLVCTGMGMDGSVNIDKVKQYGGYVIAQDPQEALIDRMPLQAIKARMVDQILNVQDVIGYFNYFHYKKKQYRKRE